MTVLLGLHLTGRETTRMPAQMPCAKSAQLTLPCVLMGTIWSTKGPDRIGLGVGVKATKRSTTSCSRSPALQHGRISTGFHARGQAENRSWRVRQTGKNEDQTPRSSKGLGTPWPPC